MGPAPDTSRTCCDVRIGRTISAEGLVHLFGSGHRGLVLQAAHLAAGAGRIEASGPAGRPRTLGGDRGQETEAAAASGSTDDQDRALRDNDKAAVGQEATPHDKRMAARQLPGAPPKPAGSRAVPSAVT
jgi:hypothetical protein